MGMTDLEYSPIYYSTPNNKTKNIYEEKKSLKLLFLFTLFFVLFILFVMWYLFPVYFLWIFKSIVLASTLSYYTCELIRFDSVKTTVQNPSFLSPPPVKISGYSFHFNYGVAAFIGLVSSALICYYF